MNKPIADVAAAMMLKNRGDRRRIEHSLKVYAYARLLGQAEFLGDELLELKSKSRRNISASNP